MFLTKKNLPSNIQCQLDGKEVQPLEGMGIEGSGIDTVVHGKVVSNVPGSQAGTPSAEEYRSFIRVKLEKEF